MSNHVSMLQVLYYYYVCFNFTFIGKYHSTSGPLHVTTRPHPVAYDVFLNGFKDAGIDGPKDLNGEEQLGEYYNYYYCCCCCNYCCS